MSRIDKSLLISLGKIEISAIILIIATNFFLNFFETNISMYLGFNFCKFWIAGLLIDIISFLILAFCLIRKIKPLLAIPIIGWLMYLLSSLFCRDALFIESKELNLLTTISIKVGEFLILSFIHLALQFLIPFMIERNDK